MTTLIITLPLTRPEAGTEFDYVLTDDAQTITRQGRVSTALLPSLSTLADEVLALAPVLSTSWHRVELPHGVLDRGVLTRRASRPRVRAVLEGILEEQLLDEPGQMHFALAPQQQAGQSAWVAACDRNWLASVLGALEAAQLQVSRVVPEFVPLSGKSAATPVYVIEGAIAPQLVVAGLQGVSVLPLGAVARELLAASGEQTVFAEPAAADLAEQVFKHPVSLLSAAQRSLGALQNNWNLAQFEFERSGQERWLKKVALAWTHFRQAPQWRAARWSAAMLIAIQFLGFNFWVWSEQAALADKRAAIRNILLQTFPETKVVLDAPMQMEREVQALQQVTGAASRQDLESMLAALSAASPANQSLSSMEFKDGIAKLKGLQLQAAQIALMSDKLKAHGYILEAQADYWLMQARGQP
jgi:general secretion pathway protein L